MFWIGWLVGYWSVLSFAGGAVHTYYVAILGPPVAVFVGLGATRLLELWRSGRLHGVALAAAAVLTTLWQARIIVGNGLPAWDTPPVWIATVALTLMGLGIAWLLLSSTRAAMPRPLLPAALVLAPLLAFPTLAALSVVIVRPNVAVPVADIGRLLRGREDDNPRSVLRETFRRMNRERLLAFLKAGHKRETYIVAVPNAVVAAPLILATRAPVMAMGGYLGDDPVLSPQRLARMRDQGKLRYVLLGGFSLAPEKQRKALAAIGQWVRANGKPVTPELWSVRRRRAGRVTATIRYRNGWITVERRQLYDLARR